MNEPLYDYNDAIKFICERCDVDNETVEEVLMLELEYMRSIGLVYEEEETNER